MKKYCTILAIYLIVILVFVQPIYGYEITFRAQIGPDTTCIQVIPAVPVDFQKQIQSKFDAMRYDIENGFTIRPISIEERNVVWPNTEIFKQIIDFREYYDRQRSHDD